MGDFWGQGQSLGETCPKLWEGLGPGWGLWGATGRGNFFIGGAILAKYAINSLIFELFFFRISYRHGSRALWTDLVGPFYVETFLNE
jgi:hypothetical protein